MQRFAGGQAQEKNSGILIYVKKTVDDCELQMPETISERICLLQTGTEQTAPVPETVNGRSVQNPEYRSVRRL